MIRFRIPGAALAAFVGLSATLTAPAAASPVIRVRGCACCLPTGYGGVVQNRADNTFGVSSASNTDV